MSNRKEKDRSPGINDAQKNAKIKYEKELAQYKQKMKPLITFLRKHKLRFNHARVGQGRVEYFRLDDYAKLLQEHKQQINKNELLSSLIKNAFQEFIFFKRPKQINIKYPKSLQPLPLGSASADKKYASFRFDTTQSKRWLVITMIVLVLAVVLFPIWPYEVKYGLWLVSLILLVVLVGIIVVRLLIYLVCLVFGYHLWIFPNLLSQNNIIGSFFPIVEYSKWEKSWFNICLRLFALSFVIGIALHIYLHPEWIDEQLDFTKETVQEVHNWGVGKLKNSGNFSQRALTNLQTILNQTADADVDPSQL